MKLTAGRVAAYDLCGLWNPSSGVAGGNIGLDILDIGHSKN